MAKDSKQRGNVVLHHGRWSLLYWSRNADAHRGWKRHRVTLTSARDRASAEAQASLLLTQINAANAIAPLAMPESRRPKAGIVYVLRAGDRNLFKIGSTAQAASLRLTDLQTGCPDELHILAQLRVSDMLTTERTLHRSLASYRVRGEWFAVPEPELQTAVATVINR